MKSCDSKTGQIIADQGWTRVYTNMCQEGYFCSGWGSLQGSTGRVENHWKVFRGWPQRSTKRMRPIYSEVVLRNDYSLIPSYKFLFSSLLWDFSCTEKTKQSKTVPEREIAGCHRKTTGFPREGNTKGFPEREISQTVQRDAALPIPW